MGIKKCKSDKGLGVVEEPVQLYQFDREGWSHGAKLPSDTIADATAYAEPLVAVELLQDRPSIHLYFQQIHWKAVESTMYITTSTLSMFGTDNSNLATILTVASYKLMLTYNMLR